MTMRERMAQAAIKELNRQDDQHRGLQDLNKVVDAILAEMETPSEEMSDAAIAALNAPRVVVGSISHQKVNDAHIAYRAMIRAIREGK